MVTCMAADISPSRYPAYVPALAVKITLSV